MRIDDDFELGVEIAIAAAGKRQQPASESCRNRGRQNWIDSAWIVAGMPGNTYEFSLSNASQIVSIQGAELGMADRKKPKLLVRFPAGPGSLCGAPGHSAIPAEASRKIPSEEP